MEECRSEGNRGDRQDGKEDRKRETNQTFVLKYIYTPHIHVLTEQGTKTCLIYSLTEMICIFVTNQSSSPFHDQLYIYTDPLHLDIHCGARSIF